MAKPTGTKTYRFIGSHAVVLEAGTPLGPGELIDLTDDDLVGNTERLVQEGWLIDATGVNVEPGPHAEAKESSKSASKEAAA